jgi:hypothetical protein
MSQRRNFVSIAIESRRLPQAAGLWALSMLAACGDSDGRTFVPMPPPPPTDAPPSEERPPMEPAAMLPPAMMPKVIPPRPGPSPVNDDLERCVQDDAGFVREASLALLGQRPASERDARAATELIRQIDELSSDDSPRHGRRVWARSLMRTAAYRDRFQELLLDALQTPRTDSQSLIDCYGSRSLPEDSPAVAEHVRDNPADVPFASAFNGLDLVRSALVLDDLSPLYRGHLFPMISRPNGCDNVDPVEQELAIREEVGHVFDAAYTRRNQVCLGCHNSEFSVTFSADAVQNRHFSLAPLLERAVFGASAGIDAQRVHAVLRTQDVLVFGFDEALCEDGGFAYCTPRGVTCDDGSTPGCEGGGLPRCDENFQLLCPETSSGDGSVLPWGMEGCGVFQRVSTDDPAGVDAKLGSITGSRASVFELEQSFARGIDKLSRGGLALDENFEPTEPEAALANLLAMNIVDIIWRELSGGGLTIATGFPRTAAAHDMLKMLSERFAASQFSLSTLLLDILETPYFNALAPDAGCGKPYGLPPLFNVWTRDEPDPDERANSPADGVHPISSRTLLSATHATLGWPQPDARFPELFLFEEPPARRRGEPPEPRPGRGEEFPPPEGNPEALFQRDVGVFLSIANKGFRGFDLSARLAWEERFGACAKPAAVETDALDAIFAKAVAAGATLGDVVLAMKDRLLGEPILRDDEPALLASLLGADLAEPFTLDHGSALRLMCGALLSSPQHLLAGLPAAGGTPVSLGPTAAESCAALEQLAVEAIEVECASGDVQVRQR